MPETKTNPKTSAQRSASRPASQRPDKHSRPAALSPDGKSSFMQDAKDFIRYAMANIRTSRMFTRESIINKLQSLAWIAPLTILIWVYAEREQQDIQKDQTIPIEVTIQDSSRVVRLQDSRDENVMAELRGSRSRLDEVKRQLTPREGSGRLQLFVDKDLTPGQIHEITLQPLLADQSIFRENGITVTNPQPARLRVFIDQIQEIDVPVEASPSSMTSLEGTPIFTPARVKLSAPQELIRQYQRDHNLAVYADLAPRSQQLEPGAAELKDVRLLPPFNDSHVHITPSVVEAKVQFKAPDASTQMKAMTVWLVATSDYTQRYRVTFDPILPNVTLIGPPTIIDAIAEGGYTPQPKALLEVNINDISGKEYSRTLKYDLPPGVTVSPADAIRTIQFKVEDASSGR